jgi:hypothetical protein
MKNAQRQNRLCAAGVSGRAVNFQLDINFQLEEKRARGAANFAPAVSSGGKFRARLKIIASVFLSIHAPVKRMRGVNGGLARPVFTR